MADSSRLLQLDCDHVWHPFTQMKHWRCADQLIIERGDGFYLIDTNGHRYIDGVSSLWCNVHGHNVPQINQAIRDQLDRIAHTTLLGLASPPSIELAGRLCHITPGSLNKVFYSDAGSTAVEISLKMAVGYWYHSGEPKKNRFIALQGAYHGDTVGAMSVGYSDLFHRPFESMAFTSTFVPVPNPCLVVHETPAGVWPSEQEALNQSLLDQCLNELAAALKRQAHQTAAIIVEPVMQGAAGMVCQPSGFIQGVAQLAREHDVLLIADEVATGFGRTGSMFACQHEEVEPDIICLAKGLTGGYLPLAATVCSDEIEQTFCGEIDDCRALYHGHTYTGNALACAAALASLDLFEQNDLINHINQSAVIVSDRLAALHDCPHVLDVRHRGLMIGIELGRHQNTAKPFEPAGQAASQICLAMRPKGLIVRPLGNVIVLMPIPAMDHTTLGHMLDIVVDTIINYPW